MEGRRKATSHIGESRMFSQIWCAKVEVWDNYVSYTNWKLASVELELNASSSDVKRTFCWTDSIKCGRWREDFEIKAEVKKSLSGWCFKSSVFLPTLSSFRNRTRVQILLKADHARMKSRTEKDKSAPDGRQELHSHSAKLVQSRGRADRSWILLCNLPLPFSNGLYRQWSAWQICLQLQSRPVRIITTISVSVPIGVKRVGAIKQRIGRDFFWQSFCASLPLRLPPEFSPFSLLSRSLGRIATPQWWAHWTHQVPPFRFNGFDLDPRRFATLPVVVRLIREELEIGRSENKETML